jgi:hypothetical protein
MLKRGLLEDPFTRRPDAGPLQPLPSYMVNTSMSEPFLLSTEVWKTAMLTENNVYCALLTITNLLKLIYFSDSLFT